MMNTFDIKIPYVEVRNKNRDIVGIIEGAEIFFEYAFHESGDFEIYCRATQNNLTLLQKDYYITLPVNADTTENLVEENSNMWVIKKIQKTNDAVGGRWIVATGKEAKQIVDKRIIRNTAKLDKDADISTEVRTKLFMPNLLEPADARRPIKGFVFEENAIGVNIAQDTQVTYENLFTYTEELYRPYGVGAKLRLDRNTKNMIYTIYKGNDRSNDIIFSQGNENLLNSDYTEDWSEYKTSALIGGEEKEEIETNPNTGETIRKYTTRTMIVLEDSSEDTDRCEVFVDAKDLQSSYNEEVNGVTVERTYTPAVYKKMLRARGKEKLASENNVVREFNGEIDILSNRNKFNEDFYLGDLVKIRDDDLQKEITVRVSKFIKVQNEEGYKEYFEYEELSTLNYEDEGSEEVEGALLTEDEENLLTEDNNVLLVEEVPTTYSTRSVAATSTGGVKISELPYATNVTEGCCLPIVSEYETKRITYGALKERLNNDLEIPDVDAATSQALNSAKSYTDTKIADLIDSAPETLDTFKEIADAFAEDQEVLDTLNAAIGNKADKTELENYVTNTAIANYYTKADITSILNSYATNENLNKKANITDLETTNSNLATLEVKVDREDTENRLRIAANETDIGNLKSSVEGLQSSKADKTELNNYVTNTALENKGYAPQSTTYTKTEVDNLIASSGESSDTKFLKKPTTTPNEPMLVGINTSNQQELISQNMYAKINASNLTASNVESWKNELLVANQISAGTTHTNQADVVVESYMSSDGSTWYRKWKSGWKECGYATTYLNSAWATVTFPIAFSTSNYIAVANAYTDGWLSACRLGTRTTTDCSWAIGTSNSYKTATHFTAYFCGY